MGARVVDADKNLIRVTYFIIGVIMGVCMTVMLYTRPQSTYAKQYFNDCGHYADGVTKCGHGSPDTNPSD